MKLLNLLPATLLFVIVSLFSNCNEQTTPANSEQWFCATIGDKAQPDTAQPTGHLRAVAYKDKFWPTGYRFKVAFFAGTSSEISLFKQAANEWEQTANVKFEYPTAGPYDIRVSFNPNGGAWSYVGTDCKLIPATDATMNLGWQAKDAYLHEIGHTLGILHEHQNPTAPIKWNANQVIKDLSEPPNSWGIDEIKYNVLNPYPLPNVITTALDAKSIMMYPIPASWTLDGFTSPGGEKISIVDAAFIQERYPFTSVVGNGGTVTLRKTQIDSLVKKIDLLERYHKTNFGEIKKILGR